jgi:hypothetical protein
MLVGLSDHRVLGFRFTGNILPFSSMKNCSLAAAVNISTIDRSTLSRSSLLLSYQSHLNSSFYSPSLYLFLSRNLFRTPLNLIYISFALLPSIFPFTFPSRLLFDVTQANSLAPRRDYFQPKVEVQSTAGTRTDASS